MAVIGAGVAGLTAAHELAVRGFAVTVFEAGDRQAVGGKARSFPVSVPDALFAGDPAATEAAPPLADVALDRAAPKATPGGQDISGAITLPAEHGFRFFPGFYRHVIDSMGRIPASVEEVDGDAVPHARAVDHLVGLRQATIARAGQGRRRACTVAIPLPCDGQRPTGRQVGRMVVHGTRIPRLRIRDWPRFGWDAASFGASLVRVVTASEARYWGELEQRSWSEYISAHRMLDESRKLFGNGLTRTFVATQAESMSARTGATILLQLLYDICLPDRVPDRGRWASADRVLDGPTSEVWLQPWLRYLAQGDPEGGELSERRLPVTFVTDRCVIGLQVEEGVVTRLEADDGTATGPFDEFVCTVPTETVQELLVRNQALARRATRLDGVFNLDTEWMNGVLFYLREDLGWFPPGHVICLDSAWALTVVDQSQAWDPVTFRDQVGVHGFRTLLSVDVSNWEEPGDLHHIPARFRQPPGESVRAEVWRQLCDHFPDLPRKTPTGVVDPGVTRGGEALRGTDDGGPRGPHPGDAEPDPGWVGRRDAIDGHVRATRDDLRASNAEPLMVNTVGSWLDRPDVEVGMENLVVAGDYVRSGTDFASMEAANESARRAVDLVCSRRRDRLGTGYATATAIPDLEGLAEPEAWWFAWPRDLARHFDRFVAYPLGWRAPMRAPMAAWAGLGTLVALRGAGRRVRGIRHRLRGRR